MRLTRYTHSCVRLEKAGRSIVIDPGIWSEPQALQGVDAVLVSHQHPDHIDQLRVAGSDIPVYSPEGAVITQVANDRVNNRVAIGDTVDVAGFEVSVVGGQHAQVVSSQQTCVNAGYIIDGLLYHPGDALHIPSQPIHTLLVPMQASWLRTSEAIAFVNEISPVQAIGIHEGQINERGIAVTNHWLGQETKADYRWLPPGTTIEIDLSE